MVHPLKIGFGARYRVVKILVWPEHPVVIEIAAVEQIKGDSFKTAIPSRCGPVRPAIGVIDQQSVPQRVAVVVESDDPVGDEDMVSGKPFAGDDALGMKSGKRRFPQENSGEDRTCAISEEDAIRQSPAPCRILLYARLQRVQERRTFAAAMNANHAISADGATAL